MCDTCEELVISDATQQHASSSSSPAHSLKHSTRSTAEYTYPHVHEHLYSMHTSIASLDCTSVQRPLSSLLYWYAPAPSHAKPLHTVLWPAACAVAAAGGTLALCLHNRTSAHLAAWPCRAGRAPARRPAALYLTGLHHPRAGGSERRLASGSASSAGAPPCSSKCSGNSTAQPDVGAAACGPSRSQSSRSEGGRPGRCRRRCA